MGSQDGIITVAIKVNRVRWGIDWGVVKGDCFCWNVRWRCKRAAMGHVIMAFIIRFEPTEGSTFISFYYSYY